MNSNISLKNNCSCVPINQRFWHYAYLLLSNGCSKCRRARNERGYGFTGKDSGRGAGSIRAHRPSCQILCPVNLNREECVCNRRNNTTRINPNDLFVASSLDDLLDMISKNRHSKLRTRYGEAHPMAKLTEQDVIKIRQLYDHGLSFPKIAKLFFVSKSEIFRIVNRKLWRHV